MTAQVTTPAVPYAAKSTEDRHRSIRHSVRRLPRRSRARGRQVVGTYADENASASSGERGPRLTATREHAERLGAELWVQHSDRLARGSSPKGEESRLDEHVLWARKAGVTLQSVQDDDAVATRCTPR